MGIKQQSPATLILLSIITCGIYYIIWGFRITKELNGFAGREIVPGWVPVVGIFIAPVEMYFFNSAFEELSSEKGFAYSSKFVLWLVTLFCFGIGHYIYMGQTQAQMNDLADMQGNSASFTQY